MSQMESNSSDADEQQLIQMSNRLNNHEIRVYQRRLDELREQYEAAKVSSMSANESLRLERVRLKSQEKDNDRVKKLLDESTETIRILRKELDEAKKSINPLQWDLREKELRACFENELIQNRAKITGMEAMLKRRQQELDHMYEMSKSTEESMQHEINQLKHALEKSQAELNRYLEHESPLKKEKENERLRDLEYLENLQRQIGSLSARNESLQTDKRDLENEVKDAKEELQSARHEIADLKKQLLETEGSNNMANHYLAQELEKAKQSRAQIRCDFLQLKREHQRLLDERRFSDETQKSLIDGKEAATQELTRKVDELTEKLRSAEKDHAELILENSTLKTSVDDSQKNLSDLQKKLYDAERTVKENEACENDRVSHLTQELKSANGRIDSLKHAIKTLDEHSEHLMNQVKNTDQKKRRAEEQVARLNAELDELRHSNESKLLTDENCSKLSEENKRLMSRVEYLETELRETHTDHREELAKLAKQLTLSKISASNEASKETSAKVQYLESELRQKDSQLRSFERQVEHAKADTRNLEKEMSSLRDEQIKMVNENTTLRQGLADAIKKIQDRDKTSEELTETNESLMASLNKANDHRTELEDENQQLKEEIAQKEKLVSYLQSQIQPKQIPKIKSSTTRCSTLLSSGSDSLNSTDIENEARQCEELEARRDQLRSTLDYQKKVLAERQRNEAIPLLKGSPTKAIHSETNDDTYSTHDDTYRTNSNRMGTMRHEIPHRWKKQFVSLLGAKCAICLEGVPRFRHAMKCRECNVTVHRHCLPRVANTCGLPIACADYYLDSHITQAGEMNGWVKLLRSDDKTGNKWRNAWATISGHQLKFSDTDNLAVNDGHFLNIDLDHEQWRIYNQSGEISGINTENLSMLIEVKLPSYTLYMLTPTIQAKQRWVQALQAATNRRMQRRHSTHPAGNSLLLALEKPQNLGIHCTVVLDDWLLIGAEEGLFATNYFHPKSPFNIVGIPTTVYYMELIKEFEMLLVICGNSRSLVAIHVQQLRRALSDSNNRMGVSFTSITNVDNCHLAVVSKPEHCEQRYVYMATIDAIHILQYVRKRDMFSPVATIRTEEPCMCITSVPNGLVYGADTFYFATASENFQSRPLCIENCPPDFPVAVVTISDCEILVVYHNYGVFVNPQGRRTRRDNLEWERAPLEFVYAAPYLYIVYCEFLEIVQIAPFDGDSSRTIMEERDVYRCRSAHHTGFGVNPNEVILTVSGLNRVELHLFNAAVNSRSGSLKRKLNETISSLNHSKRKL